MGRSSVGLFLYREAWSTGWQKGLVSLTGARLLVAAGPISRGVLWACIQVIKMQ